MRDKMKTNNTTLEKGQVSLVQAMQEHETEVQKNVPYVRLADGESKKLSMTGNISKTQDKFGRQLLEFELQDRVENGNNKTISFNIKNPIVKQILQRLKEGRNELVLHRIGSGTDTRYSLIEL
jgi:hypothetical protein